MPVTRSATSSGTLRTVGSKQNLLVPRLAENSAAAAAAVVADAVPVIVVTLHLVVAVGEGRVAATAAGGTPLTGLSGYLC